MKSEANHNYQFLIVEEDEIAIKLLRTELAREGYKILISKSVDEASKLISNHEVQIDLCLVSLNISGKNGMGVLIQIKQIRNEVPVILLTSHENKKTLNNAVQNGAFAFIEKPFSKEKDIIPLIKNAVASVNLKKENVYLNEQILHSSKLAVLGELSATVVHDIRGPLAMIQVTCEDMFDECQEKSGLDLETLKTYIAHINKASSKIKHLVDHLRNFSRNDKNEVEEQKKFSVIIDDCLFLVGQKIRKLGINVNCHIDEELNHMELICYPNKLEQVIMNLMSNACDAMKNSSKKELTIKVKMDSTDLYFCISDSGVGIPDDLKSKIFDSFFTTKTKGEGTGLGLSIVQNRVREHGGELLFESEFGKGTTFSVKLPSPKLVPIEQNVGNLHTAA